MTVPEPEALGEVSYGCLERLLGRHPAPPGARSTGRPPGHRPDGGALARITGDGADGQTRQSATGRTAHGATLGLLILTQRVTVLPLEFGERRLRVPVRLLRRPVEARKLCRVLLLDCVIATVDDPLSVIGGRWENVLGLGGWEARQERPKEQAAQLPGPALGRGNDQISSDSNAHGSPRFTLPACTR